jgi:hypothetical protein
VRDAFTFLFFFWAFNGFAVLVAFFADDWLAVVLFWAFNRFAVLVTFFTDDGFTWWLLRLLRRTFFRLTSLKHLTLSICLRLYPLILHSGRFFSSLSILFGIFKLHLLTSVLGMNASVSLTPALMAWLAGCTISSTILIGFYTCLTFVIAAARCIPIVANVPTRICVEHALHAVLTLDSAFGIDFFFRANIEAIFMAPGKSASDVTWVLITYIFVKAFQTSGLKGLHQCKNAQE